LIRDKKQTVNTRRRIKQIAFNSRLKHYNYVCHTSHVFADLCSAYNSSEQHHVFGLSVCPSVRPSVRLMTRFSVLCAGISLKFGTNINHVRGHCEEGFKAQRSM